MNNPIGGRVLKYWETLKTVCDATNRIESFLKILWGIIGG
jgi:hypothetical protein